MAIITKITKELSIGCTPVKLSLRPRILPIMPIIPTTMAPMYPAGWCHNKRGKNRIPKIIIAPDKLIAINGGPFGIPDNTRLNTPQLAAIVAANELNATNRLTLSFGFSNHLLRKFDKGNSTLKVGIK